MGLSLVSLTKEMWMDEIEAITEQFRSGGTDLAEAIRELERLGLDSQEARDLLQEAIS